MADATHITAIKPTQRDPDRATIRVAGRVVATLPRHHIADLGIEVGTVWDEALAQRIAEAAAYDKALRQAINRLARRGRSRRELDRKLRELGHDEPVRQRVLDRLVELGYLDDEALGRQLLIEIQSRKPAGPMLLRQKLMQKGLDRELIDRLVTEAVDDSDQAEQALALLRQRLRSMQRLDPATRKRRLYGQLARRGFAADAIRSAFAAADLDEDEA